MLSWGSKKMTLFKYQTFTYVGISKLFGFTLNPSLFLNHKFVKHQKYMAQKVNFALEILFCACKIS